MEKIEVERERDGKIIRVMPHMIADAKRFGLTEYKRKSKEPPKELTSKKIILPPDPLTEPVSEVQEVPPPKTVLTPEKKSVKKPVSKKK